MQGETCALPWRLFFLASRSSAAPPPPATANLQTPESTVLGVLPQRLQLSRLHETQFYSDDASFLDTFAKFIVSAIKAGDVFIVVLTNSLRDALLQRL